MVILAALIFILSGAVHGQGQEGILKISSRNTKIICKSAQRCDDLKEKIYSMLSEESSLNEFREILRFVSHDESIKSLGYTIDENKVVVSIVPQKIIDSVKIEGIEADVLPAGIASRYIRQGTFYDETKVQKAEEGIKKELVEQGYLLKSVEPRVVENENFVQVSFHVSLRDYVKIVDVVIENEDTLSGLASYEEIKGLVKGRLNLSDIKVIVSQLNEELVDIGYTESEARYVVEKLSVEQARLKVEVKLGKKYHFYFHNVQVFSSEFIVSNLKTHLADTRKVVSHETLQAYIDEIYRKKGFFKTTIRTRQIKGVSKFGREFENFFVDVDEGEKIVVREILYRGNDKVHGDELRDLYYDKASLLLREGFLDEKGLKDFQEQLTLFYHSKGYVLSEVSMPIVNIEGANAKVEFIIKEGEQCLLDNIKLVGLESIDKKDLYGVLANKIGKPLNVLEIKNDLTKLIEGLKEKGYYFIELAVKNPQKIIQYNADFTKASISLVLINTPLIKLNDVLITGYNKTKRVVIDREVQMAKADTVTPGKILRLRERLLSLGLFSTVKATLIVSNKRGGENESLVNLVINVKERDFGVAEVAPGFRTDLGPKVSVGINYNNLWGMNRTVSLRTTTNYRTSLGDFHPDRERSNKKLIEYRVRGSYEEPYLFHKILDTKLVFDVETSFQRKRYYRFDADVFKVIPRITKSLNDHISVSLKYQREQINQFNTVQVSDETELLDFNEDDRFRIGSLTPSISFDYRNRPVNPSSGFFLGLSWEFANPFLGSTDDDKQEVNFYRLVSRNKFYIPANDWIFAFSLAMGVQKNLATGVVIDSSGKEFTRGFIPGIRVFRLNGVDSVRGFSDDEINRLENGVDIGNIIVRDKAYFANFKFEPRYQLSESTVLGLFFDAGEVFVNSLKPLDLRSAVGATFKFVTPVGTLDFNYGVKLRRLRFGDGSSREKFGRFNLLIGFF